MGTRGFLGFVIDGEEKISYVQFDSYPSGLGLTTLKWLRAAMEAPDVLRERVRALRVVDPDSEPTDEDIERLRKYARPNVSTKDLHEWYVLLRETQGDPHAILEAGVIEDGSDFPADSLFCEYGYLVDLDEMRFEFYTGFVTHAHSSGRFAGREVVRPNGYRPVELYRSWPLSDLPTALLDPYEDEDEGGAA